MCKRIANTLSVFELLEKFSTERKAVMFLEKCRWGDNRRCARCNTSKNIRSTNKGKFSYWCKSCRQTFNVKTNTAIEGSNLSYRLWLVAAYLMVTARKGISSVQLSKELGVSIPTAWFMLHRLRQVEETNVFSMLSGVVEIDEVYIGGKEENKHESKKLNNGRGSAGKVAVVGMKQRGGKMRGFTVGSVSGVTVQSLIKGNIKEGSTVMTDELPVYSKMDGYDHKTVNHSKKEYAKGFVHVNGIEGAWSVFKRGFIGVYHHWSKKHNQRYVREFIFRLGTATCEVDTIDRIASLFCGLQNKRMRYIDLIA